MDSFLKRKLSEEAGSSKKVKLELCPHGIKCYRKNPHHFKEFDHPHLLELVKSDDSKIPENFPQDKSVYLEQIKILRSLLKLKPVEKMDCEASGSVEKAPAKSMLEKLNRTAPYNLFFTTIPESPETLKQENSITFTDLLCPSLGALKCSLQINFMIDIMWLMEQYKARNVEKKPLTILYGWDFPDMKEYMEKFLPHVTSRFITMKDPFGCHHAKIGIYVYEDKSLRVVVSTANLYYEDWNHYNQGLWVSPRCPLLESPSAVAGDSITGFKKSLLEYLRHYKLPILEPWIECVKSVDFSEIRVFLITSIPGKHYPDGTGSHVHRVARLLSEHCTLPDNSGGEGPLAWGVMAQSSSIGSLGKAPSDWLRSTLLRSLAAHNKTHLVSNSNATLNVIFPTVENVLGGYFGPDSGGCLPYSKATNEKQRWLQKYLHQWKADRLKRTRAMPHIKTYCRVSPCLSKLAWFLLTSANMSKSAWGGSIQKDGGVYIRSCEAGVMFLPKFFEDEYFYIENSPTGRTFPFMYDLPLTEYKSSDYPWCN